MKSFTELEHRLKGLLADLDGQLWHDIITDFSPENFPADQTVHDLAFRDAKALGGYVPDLRSLMGKILPKDLTLEERNALIAIHGLFNLAARLPLLLIIQPIYQEEPKLHELFNGYRQILMEVARYLGQS